MCLYFYRYQWFCHLDDDEYVNVPQLSHFLQKYDSHEPHYIGKWPGYERNETAVNVSSYVASYKSVQFGSNISSGI